MATLVSENLTRWNASLLPQRLLAIGDDGTGDPFCVEGDEPVVHGWHPIEGNSVPLAPDLYAFGAEWIAGTIAT